MKRLALRLSITAVFLACGVIAIAQSLKKKEGGEEDNGNPGGVVAAPGVLPDVPGGSSLIPPKVGSGEVALTGGTGGGAGVSPAGGVESPALNGYGQGGASAYGQTGGGQSGGGQGGGGQNASAYGQSGAGQSAYGQTAGGAGQSGYGQGQYGQSNYGGQGENAQATGQGAYGQSAYGQSGQGAYGQSAYGQAAGGQVAGGQAASGQAGDTVTAYGQSGDEGQSGSGEQATIKISDDGAADAVTAKSGYSVGDGSAAGQEEQVSSRKPAGASLKDDGVAKVSSAAYGGVSDTATGDAQTGTSQTAQSGYGGTEYGQNAQVTGQAGQNAQAGGGQGYGGQGSGSQAYGGSAGQYTGTDGKSAGVAATTQPSYSQQVGGGGATVAAGTPGDESLEGAQKPSLKIEKIAPREIQVGTQATFEVVVTNEGRADALDVMVVDQTPQGTQLVSTSPPVDQQAEDGSLVWRLGTLKPNETRTIKIELMPLEESEEVGSVARVLFEAQASVKTRCTKPQLVIEGSGPESVMIGDDAVLEYTIINQGTGAAKNVVILEDVPDGFSHAAGRELEYEIGTLRPNERYPVRLKLRADAAKLGVVNVLRAKGEGQVEAQKQVSIDIVAPQLAIQLQGPQARYLNRRAKYKAHVSNSGTAAARNVDVVVRLPKGVEFADSPKGEYDSRSHVVYWNIKQLDPQKQNSFELTVTPKEIGAQRLAADAQGNLSAKVSSEIETSVDGLSELTFTVSDVADPIEFAGETTYEIVIQNIGTKSDTNINLIAALPKGLQFKSAKGTTRNAAPEGVAEGQLIRFEPIAKIGPNQDARYRITVVGEVAGDYNIQVQVSSDEARNAVTREESTRVLPAESP